MNNIVDRIPSDNQEDPTSMAQSLAMAENEAKQIERDLIAPSEPNDDQNVIALEGNTSIDDNDDDNDNENKEENENKIESEQIPSAMEEDPKVEFIGRRIAKQFRVASTNKVHQSTGGKVNKIFFGTVEKLLVPSDVEKWRIIYDDGDVDIMSHDVLVVALDYYDTKKQLDTINLRKRDEGKETGTESEMEIETSAGTKRHGKNIKTKATPPKKGKGRTNSKVTRSEPVPIWEGEPNEKIEGGWPDGWVKKIFARKHGASKGATDRYWYSPNKKIKLRSLVEVKKFLKALIDTNGDEQKAKKLMKTY